MLLSILALESIVELNYEQTSQLLRSKSWVSTLPSNVAICCTVRLPHNPANQENRAESPTVLKIVAFKRAILHFLKRLANLCLDQN
jgi:hypothetical protein